MKTLSPELRTKLELSDATFFVSNFEELARGADEAYEVITQSHPDILLPFLKLQIDAGAWIINEGHVREALTEIINDVALPDRTRYEASIHYIELEEDGMLEAPEEPVHFGMLEDEELFDEDEYRYYVDDSEHRNKYPFHIDNEEAKKAILDLLNVNGCSMDEIIFCLEQPEYNIASALLELLKDGLVNCTEGMFSLGIGYELRDNMILKISRQAKNLDSNPLQTEFFLNDLTWDDEDEDLTLESDPEFEKALLKMKSEAAYKDLPFIND